MYRRVCVPCSLISTHMHYRDFRPVFSVSSIFCHREMVTELITALKRLKWHLFLYRASPAEEETPQSSDFVWSLQVSNVKQVAVHKTNSYRKLTLADNIQCRKKKKTTQVNKLTWEQSAYLHQCGRRFVIAAFPTLSKYFVCLYTAHLFQPIMWTNIEKFLMYKSGIIISLKEVWVKLNGP